MYIKVALAVLVWTSTAGSKDLNRGPFLKVLYRNKTISISMESYLERVVSAETWPGWHIEALKAQAVASRSYALRKLLHAKGGFDLKATVQDQVMSKKVRPDAVQAVRLTRGLVLTYKGVPIRALFHSTCGGKTTYAERVWPGEGVPYLRPVECHYCEISPRFLWQSRVPVGKARKKLARLGLSPGSPIKIEPLDPDEAGRCSKVRLGGKDGIIVPVQKLRKVLGFDVLRSAIFSAKVKDGYLVLEGRGAGHGVGMCQWGAEGMARKGKNFREILEHYYPGTRIRRAY
ncbi:MAG: SpoIID/LytB domain-containing protein [Deltaproteobacteria bacterium]|nr:SpoIID/LytB domain-containing protein [Deltaproteobacteria bacterium]